MNSSEAMQSLSSLDRAAELWQRYFPNPVETLKVFHQLSLDCCIGAIEKAGASRSQGFQSDAYFRLHKIIEHVVIPSIEAKGEVDLRHCFGKLLKMGGFGYGDFTEIFNALGMANERDGSYSRTRMVEFVRTLHGLSEVSNYLEENEEAIALEVA